MDGIGVWGWLFMAAVVVGPIVGAVLLVVLAIVAFRQNRSIRAIESQLAEDQRRAGSS